MFTGYAGDCWGSCVGVHESVVENLVFTGYAGDGVFETVGHPALVFTRVWSGFCSGLI